jgi:hypothetical protein
MQKIVENAGVKWYRYPDKIDFIFGAISHRKNEVRP